MEQPQFIKCEPGWQSDTGECYNFGSSDEAATVELVEVKTETANVVPDQKIGKITEEFIKEEHEIQDVKEEAENEACVLNKSPSCATEVPGSEVKKRNNHSESQGSSVKGSLGLEAGPWICNVCGETSRTESLLKRDMFVHANSRVAQDNTSTFSVCYKTFTTPNNLKIHMRLHTGKGFTCSVCCKTYTSKWYLRHHMTVHTGLRPHICDVCGKSYTWKSVLVKHKHTHTVRKPHACSLCGKSFLSSSILDNHLLTHFDSIVDTCERLYKCIKCNKTFGLSSEFYLHSISHLGVGQYTFKDCGVGYLKLWDVNNNTYVDTGERVYSCSECPETFSWKCDFKKHMLSHIGNRPVLCSVCGKAFLQKSNLITHLATH
ncbi:zinc finger protein 879 isoform X1 [Anabrus simplex]|uniref:zinc finger protein 879 isoform X1 n=1 Tax=Anabrus simplex TaxID=316456 RepID=UPI0035A326BF